MHESPAQRHRHQPMAVVRASSSHTIRWQQTTAMTKGGTSSLPVNRHICQSCQALPAACRAWWTVQTLQSVGVELAPSEMHWESVRLLPKSFLIHVPRIVTSSSEIAGARGLEPRGARVTHAVTLAWLRNGRCMKAEAHHVHCQHPGFQIGVDFKRWLELASDSVEQPRRQEAGPYQPGDFRPSIATDYTISARREEFGARIIRHLVASRRTSSDSLATDWRCKSCLPKRLIDQGNSTTNAAMGKPRGLRQFFKRWRQDCEHSAGHSVHNATRLRSRQE